MINKVRRLITSALGIAIASAISLRPAFASGRTWRSKFDPSWVSDGTKETIVKSLPAFFGNARGKYIDLRPSSTTIAPDFSLAAQYAHVFGGVPGKTLFLSNGMRVLTTTSPHNSGEIAMAVTLGDSATIVAAALVHSFSGKYNEVVPSAKQARHPSEDRQTLTIFYPKHNSPIPEVNQALVRWTGKRFGNRRAKLEKGLNLRLEHRKFGVQVRKLQS